MARISLSPLRLKLALLVEHEADVRASLRSHLESRGFTVDDVVDVERASMLLRTKAYDLVILDMGAMRRSDLRVAIDTIPAVSHVATRQVRLDAARRRAFVRGRQVVLTKQEFDLLFRLMSNRGRVFTRASLLESVWRDDRFVTERTVDTLVSRLRRKIERDPQNPALILTAWGVGYKFVDDD